MRATALFFCGLLISCGSESKSENPGDPTAPGAAPQSSSFYVADAAALPACDASRQGFLVYIGAEKKLQACQDAVWIDLELPKGEKGDKGEKGEDATPPDASGVVEQFLCAGLTADLDGSADTETIGLTATITKFATGDFEVYCMDRRIDTAFTYADSSSKTSTFSAKNVGVSEGKLSCLTFYATAEFDITAKSLTWSATGGTSAAPIACETVVGSN